MQLVHLIITLLFCFTSCTHETAKKPKGQSHQDSTILSYQVNPKTQNLVMFWQDSMDEPIKTFRSLKKYLGRKKLIFAMNGGMFLKDFSPQGLYIENHKMLRPLDTAQNAYGNFYMQPNGVFLLNKNRTARVIRSTDFVLDSNLKYATQSGPMLVIDSSIHPRFIKGSQNLHIRNGVGILPNGEVLFAISKRTINFYDFAQFFRGKGCKNALYLDGFVSRCYLPERSKNQMDGQFGVIISVIGESY